MQNERSHVTILPKQLMPMAAFVFAFSIEGAIRVTQEGSVLEINTGKEMFKINAQGRIINHSERT